MITILLGKSASGKDTLREKMVKNGYKKIMSVTTRPMRDSEIDGKEYYFIDDKEYEMLKKNNRIVCGREYNTTFGIWKYGILWDDRYVGKDDYVGILDVDGILELQKIADIDVIYLNVSEKIRKERAMKRDKGFNEEEWERREREDEKKF